MRKLCFFLFSIWSVLSYAQSDPKEQINSFSQKLDSLRTQKQIPGLAVAVVKDNKLFWSNGYGSSHLDSDDGQQIKAVSADTPFWIASVTKTFMGLLFLQLEELGRVDLEAPINTMKDWEGFCDWLSNSGIVFGKDLQCDREIALRHVLNHTVNGSPGTAFSYNPIMYSRLSRYLEELYGNDPSAVELGQNTLAQLMETHILGPADMTRSMSSQWQREKAEVFFDLAEGYQFKNGRYIRLKQPERHIAGGAGVVSTVQDLAKYVIALNKGKLASPAVMKRLYSPPLNSTGKPLPYAFGWYVQNYRNETLVWHGGWGPENGFSALLLQIPQRKLAFIILANSEDLWWGNPLNEARVQDSPFAQLFLKQFVFTPESK
jgi:CubicO group peptidase (beta-lactamase class C family)